MLNDNMTLRFQNIRPFLALIVGLALPTTVPTLAQTPPVAVLPPAPSPVPDVPITDYRLANGLRVILVPDHSAPTISLCVAYAVGSRDEQPGQEGWAHLYEHLMFEGSENVGRGEHRQLVEQCGGTLNALTGQDETVYFETLPANQMPLALFLEADRMRGLDIRPAHFANARTVVEAEKRQRHDNSPGDKELRSLLHLAYTRFPYAHETIGTDQDLDAATVNDLETFGRTFYVPGNAALALVGDFDPAAAQAAIAGDFSAIPTRPMPPLADVTEPLPSRERRVSLTDPRADGPMWSAAYLTPAEETPQFGALNLLTDVLALGDDSCLDTALVDTRRAVDVAAAVSGRRGPGLFHLSVSLPPGTAPESVEKTVSETILRLQTSDISGTELRRVKNFERAAMIKRMQTTAGRAVLLAEGAALHDNPRQALDDLARMEAVSAADLRRAAVVYLVPENRVVISVRPPQRASSR